MASVHKNAGAKKRRVAAVTLTALGVSAVVRAFLVRLVDGTGGVEVIAFRATPGWSLEEHLPSEAFRAHGYRVLVRGNENGVAGEGLLRANGYAVWVLLFAAALVLVARLRRD